MTWLLPLALLAAVGVTHAEVVAVCYNYGCLDQAEVHYDDSQMAAIRRLLEGTPSADDERWRLSLAIGRLLGWAGEQSPIAADRGGNYADQGVNGRMDCIDHATTTTRLLQMLEARGWLRHHRVLAPALRVRYLFATHFAAQIEELAPSPGSPGVFVVDSWFRDNGQPAVVNDLSSWLAGADDEDEDFRTVALPTTSGSRQR
ncbi:MAG: hypothetical protein JNL84_08450 [Candidatus Accumulibacter sp.]|nr:hypothetical protein [Accumulibacter sp.]